MKMARKVKDDGHMAAQILLVGEAPGRDELAAGYPFAGASGRKLAQWFKRAELRRSDCYVTNILGDIPPAKNGDIDAALKRGKLSREDVRAGFDYVEALANRLPDVSVICPVGNYASYPFSPGGKLQWDRHRPGITSIRGSIYPYVLENGRTISVVPTIHPAAVLRKPVWEKDCIRDWIRIAGLVGKPYEPPPKRDHKIYPTLNEIDDFVNSIIPLTDIVALDIETWGDQIQCIGFSLRSDESITIPTTKSYWQDDSAYNRMWKAVAHIIEDPTIELGMQNGLFDSWWLEHYGLVVQGYHWDTLGMHHAIDPIDSHTLDHMASIFTRQPYWKDEAKSAEEIVRIAKDVGMDRLYVYNGIDVAVTRELISVFQGMLDRRGMMNFYLTHYADMHEPLLGMMRRGIGVDRSRMSKLWAEHLHRARQLRDQAWQIAGRPLFRFDKTKCERDMLELYEVDLAWRHEEEMASFDQWPEMRSSLLEKGHKEAQIRKKWDELAKKQISDTILGEVLYDEWNAPKPKLTETERYKVDNVGLKSTANSARERVRGLPHKDDILRLIPMVIDHRRQAKLGSFLNPARVDPDARMRCEYRFATRSGRLASRENPRGTGSNLQNYDRTLLSIFIPRPGHVFVEVDLSQAESRVVKVLTGDPQMIEQARLHPSVFDEHRANAAIIFSAIEQAELEQKDITYEQRQLGKRVVHATNYWMGGQELSRTILRETGDVVTPPEAQLMIDAYLERYPAVREYHSHVRRAIMAHEQLFTSWGRRVDMRDMRKDDELYKFGYSYIPQSEIGDLTNHWGLKPLDKWIQANRMDAEIVGQKHDSILVDCLPEEAWYVMNALDTWLSRERHYGKIFSFDIPLSIPCEFAVGGSWQMEHEWRSLPTEEKVLDAARSLVNQ